MTEKTAFYRNNFDLLRILAAGQVMVTHTFRHLKLDTDATWFQWLDCFPGVPVFFVISGFLVSASYERSRSTAQYFTNRFLRIYPALWACLGCSVLAANLIGNVSFSRWETLPWLFGQVTFVQFFNPDFLRGYGTGVLNGSLWTITVELQFYLLLPLVYRMFIRRDQGEWKMLLLLAACFLCSAVLWTAGIPRSIDKWLQVSFLPHLSLFLLGSWIRRRNLHTSSLLRGKVAVWFIVYAAFTASPVPESIRLPLSRILLALLTVSGAYSLPGLADRLLHGQDLSYGVYIYHMVVVNALIETKGTGSYNDFIYATLATLALAAGSWWLVEKPFLRKKTGTLKAPVAG